MTSRLLKKRHEKRLLFSQVLRPNPHAASVFLRRGWRNLTQEYCAERLIIKERTVSAPSGYALVYADEFSKLSVSANRTADANWYSGQAWGGGFGKARFVPANAVNSPFSIVEKDGETALRIHMTRDANGKLQSGLISNTFPDGTSRTVRDGDAYGYYEARLWLPTGKGVWSAFWLT